MKKHELLEHPLIIQLNSIDLEKDELSWELHDFIASIIECCDTAYLCGIENYSDIQLFIEILSPFVEECRSLEIKYPENQVISHNRGILLLVTTNLYLSSMSRPHRKAS